MSSRSTRWSGRPRPQRPPLVASDAARGTWPGVDAALARGARWSTRSPGCGPRCVATTSPPRCWSIRSTSGTPPAPRSCRSGRCTRSTAISWCPRRVSRCCGSAPRRRPSSCRRTAAIETRGGDGLVGLRLRRTRGQPSGGVRRGRGRRAARPGHPGGTHRGRSARRLRVPGPPGGRGAPRARAVGRRAGASGQGAGGDRADPPVAARLRRRRDAACTRPCARA